MYKEMGNKKERNFFDESEIRKSSVEGMNINERIELRETNRLVKKIKCEIEGTINYDTPDKILSEVYFGGDGDISDFHLDHF